MKIEDISQLPEDVGVVRKNQNNGGPTW